MVDRGDTFGLGYIENSSGEKTKSWFNELSKLKIILDK